MVVDVGVLGMTQSDGSVETLTTEEAMHALFPQGVIDQANRVLDLPESNLSGPIAKDASLKRTL